MIKVHFHAGETLRSFATRLARRNRTPETVFLARLGLIHGKDVDQLPPVAVAKATGLAVDAVSSSVVRAKGRHAAFAGRIARPEAIAPGMRGCPACLREDLAAGGHPEETMHERLLWRLAWAKACPRHGVDLVEAPRTGGLWERLSSMAEAEVRPIEATVFEAWMAGALDGTGEALPAPFDAMSPGSVAEACRVLGELVAEGRTDADLGASLPRGTADLGLEVLRGGLSAFDALLDRACGLDAEAHGGGAVKETGFPYRGLRRWLKRDWTDLHFAPLRAAMAEHSFANAPLAPGSTLFGKVLGERRFHTRKSLEKQTGLMYTVVVNHLERLGLEPCGLYPTHMWRVGDVADAVEALTGSILAAHLVEEAGIPRSQWLRLVRDGRILPIAPKRASVDFLRISRAEIARFEADLVANTRSVDVLPKGYRLLPNIGKATGRSTTPVIDAVMTGAVDAVLMAGPGAAYARVAVALDPLRLHLDAEFDRLNPTSDPNRVRMRRLQRFVVEMDG